MSLTASHYTVDVNTKPAAAHDTAAVSALAARLRPRTADLLWVFLGGSLGTLLRSGAEELANPIWGATLSVWTINTLGAFALGMLVQSIEQLGERGAARYRTLRLLIGTGMLGGFTTYSSFATGAVMLLMQGDVWLGFGYVSATLVLGALASWGGIAAARALAHRRGAHDA